MVRITTLRHWTSMKYNSGLLERKQSFFMQLFYLKGRETEGDLPSTGLLSKCLDQPVLGQAEV